MKSKLAYLAIFLIISSVAFSQTESTDSMPRVSKCDTIDFDYIYQSIEFMNNYYKIISQNSKNDSIELENNFKEINIRLTSLSSEITNINKQLALNNSSVLNNYIEKLQNIKSLNESYRETTKDILYEINTEKRVTSIAEVNNPGSDQLGFKFTEIIQNAALSSVGKTEISTIQKSKFENKLENVVSGVYTFTSHSFAKQIASLNPAANATITVFNFLANYYVSDYQTTGFFSKEIDVNEEKLFTEKQLAEYLSSIEEFIVYYEVLSTTNQDFKLSLIQLEQEFKSINQSLEELDSILETNNKKIDEINVNNVSNQDIFEISSIYGQTLESVQIINNSFIGNYQEYVFAKKDYYTKYIEYIEKSEDLLTNELVKNVNLKTASKKREDLIEQCNEGINELDKYEDDINKIKEKYNSIW